MWKLLCNTPLRLYTIIQAINPSCLFSLTTSPNTGSFICEIGWFYFKIFISKTRFTIGTFFPPYPNLVVTWNNTVFWSSVCFRFQTSTVSEFKVGTLTSIMDTHGPTHDSDSHLFGIARGRALHNAVSFIRTSDNLHYLKSGHIETAHCQPSEPGTTSGTTHVSVEPNQTTSAVENIVDSGVSISSCE